MAVLGSRVVSRSDRLSLRRDSVAGSCGQGHTLGAHSWRRSRLSRYLLLAFNLLRVAGALYHYLEARTACCSECYRASSGKRRNVWAQSASWLWVNLAPITSYRLLKYFSSSSTTLSSEFTDRLALKVFCWAAPSSMSVRAVSTVSFNARSAILSDIEAHCSRA